MGSMLAEDSDGSTKDVDFPRFVNLDLPKIK